MLYSLLLSSREASEADVSPDEMARFQAAFDKYAKAMRAAGVLVSAVVLQPVADTKTVTNHAESLRVHNGPATEIDEKLNGDFVIDVPDVDAAIEWAGRCPGALYGTVEVRPVAIVFRDGGWAQP